MWRKLRSWWRQLWKKSEAQSVVPERDYYFAIANVVPKTDTRPWMQKIDTFRFRNSYVVFSAKHLAKKDATAALQSDRQISVLTQISSWAFPSYP